MNPYRCSQSSPQSPAANAATSVMRTPLSTLWHHQMSSEFTVFKELGSVQDMGRGGRTQSMDILKGLNRPPFCRQCFYFWQPRNYYQHNTSGQIKLVTSCAKPKTSCQGMLESMCSTLLQVQFLQNSVSWWVHVGVSFVGERSWILELALIQMVAYQ